MCEISLSSLNWSWCYWGGDPAQMPAELRGCSGLRQRRVLGHRKDRTTCRKGSQPRKQTFLGSESAPTNIFPWFVTAKHDSQPHILCLCGPSLLILVTRMVSELAGTGRFLRVSWGKHSSEKGKGFPRLCSWWTVTGIPRLASSAQSKCCFKHLPSGTHPPAPHRTHKGLE